MKNILIISALFPPEPVVSANLSFDIATSLSIENKVTVLCPYPSRPNGMIFQDFEISNSQFNVIRVKSFISKRSTIYSRFRESHSFGLSAARYIIKNSSNINLIYINTWPILSQLYILYFAKKYSIPVITHVQDIYPESLSSKIPFIGDSICKLFLPIDKYILNNSRRIVTISESMKIMLMKTRYLESKKIDVVYNWQDENRFILKTNVVPLKDNNFTFMFLGSINVNVNLYDIIYAFKEASLSSCRLIIAGEGPEKNNLINYVNKLNLSNVSFLSFDPSEVPQIQAISDVLILSLLKGGSSLAFPSKIPAYMFSSKPILAYVDDPSEISKVIHSAKCGWVSNSGNISDLISCMQLISKTNKDELNLMGRNGYEYAYKKFSREVNRMKIVSLINNHLI